jgi:hypothetical protein
MGDAETKIAFLPVAMTQTLTVAILFCFSDPESSGENGETNSTMVPKFFLKVNSRVVGRFAESPTFDSSITKFYGGHYA